MPRPVPSRLAAIVVSGLFALFLLVFVVWLVNQSHGEVAEAQFQLAWLTRAVGLFIAAAGGLVLLIRTVAGDGPARLTACVLPVLAGVLLIEPHWAVALALGAAVAGFAFRHAATRFVGRTPRGPVGQVGPPDSVGL